MKKFSHKFFSLREFCYIYISNQKHNKMKTSSKPSAAQVQNAKTCLIAENNKLKIENSDLYRQLQAAKKQNEEMQKFITKVKNADSVNLGSELLLMIKTQAHKISNSFSRQVIAI